MAIDGLLTIGELSKLTGVEKRTIDYYTAKERYNGEKGSKGGCAILRPTYKEGYNYRLYDQTAVETLWKICIYRELDYTIAQIKDMLDNPKPFSEEMLTDQIKKLKENKEREMRRFDDMITFANSLKVSGTKLDSIMQFSHLMPVDDSIHVFNEIANIVVNAVTSLFDALDESDEMSELIIVFLNNIRKCMGNGYTSLETQMEVKNLDDSINSFLASMISDLFINNFETIFSLMIGSVVDSEGFEDDDDDGVIEVIEATKEALCIVSDWVREAKAFEKISDIKSFAKSRSDIALELDQKNGDGFFEEECIGFITELCNKIRDNQTALINIVEFYRSGSEEIQELDRELGEGAAEFAANAIEFFLNEAETRKLQSADS